MQYKLKLTRKRHKFIACAAVILAILLVATLFFASQVSAPKQLKKTPPIAVTTPAAKPVPAVMQTLPTPTVPDAYSDPTNTSVVVNKHRVLQPISYVPSDLIAPNVPTRSNISNDERLLRAEPAAALERLVSAAAVEGIKLNLLSGYRSYNTQVIVYNSFVRRDGQPQADTYSARPGHSEHQTGFGADLGGLSNPGCNLASCYGHTAEGKWLALHAHEYGYIVRYLDGKEGITGYQAEPWHIRYVGVTVAANMRAQNVETLEEMFGLPAAPTYQ